MLDGATRRARTATVEERAAGAGTRRSHPDQYFTTNTTAVRAGMLKVPEAPS